MRVSKGHSFSDHQKNENQSSISVFQFWKTTWKTKLAYTLNLSKGQLFSERATNGKRILKQIVFHFPKKVTLAQTSFGTSFSGLGSERSTPLVFFYRIRIKQWLLKNTKVLSENFCQGKKIL